MIKRVFIIAATVACLAACARPSSEGEPRAPATPTHVTPPPRCDCGKPGYTPTVADGTPRWC